MGRIRRERGEVSGAYAKRWAYCPSCPRCGRKFAGYIFLLDHMDTGDKRGWTPPTQSVLAEADKARMAS